MLKNKDIYPIGNFSKNDLVSHENFAYSQVKNCCAPTDALAARLYTMASDPYTYGIVNRLLRESVQEDAQGQKAKKVHLPPPSLCFLFEK